MSYFNYHATAKRLIAEGKLKRYYIAKNHNGISPALVLIFDDTRHPVMPIRAHRFEEYFAILEKKEQLP